MSEATNKTANKKGQGERTLLASVVMSSPGPIVVGIGLFVGRSSTQLADFVRRTAELAAIIVSWIIYRVTSRDGGADPARKARLEAIANRCVGVAMCVSGAIMLALAFVPGDGEQGNVIPGLVIAVLGVITNTWFWLRYRRLNRREPNAILAVQSRLYRAKSLVDACVTAALAAVAIAPGTAVANIMDVAGSAVVAAYLLFTGITTLLGRRSKAA